jgi:hypothetical protein
MAVHLKPSAKKCHIKSKAQNNLKPKQEPKVQSARQEIFHLFLHQSISHRVEISGRLRMTIRKLSLKRPYQ